MIQARELDIQRMTKEDCQILADSFEKYLDRLERIMIIPEELIEKAAPFKEAIKYVRKNLIGKLRKGDKSVFKDIDEWNPF